MSNQDNRAFAAACEAAPDVHPDRIRVIVDAYLADLHISVLQRDDGRVLSPDEAEAAFQPRAVEG